VVISPEYLIKYFIAVPAACTSEACFDACFDLKWCKCIFYALLWCDSGDFTRLFLWKINASMFKMHGIYFAFPATAKPSEACGIPAEDSVI
jgi:hypothetical protein